MSAIADSRKQVLERINKAAPPTGKHAESYANLPRPYIHRGALDAAATVHLLIERLHDYDAEVVECAPGELRDAIATQLTASGKRVFVAPAGLPAEWMVPGFDWKVDHGLTHQEIEKAEGVVTAVFCAIADSGTIVLHHSPQEGRRVLTLLPDWHLCILNASQVVETLPEYFSRSEKPPSLATYISGPSATADIEMTRIKGVHGPRSLHVILVHDKN